MKTSTRAFPSGILSRMPHAAALTSAILLSASIPTEAGPSYPYSFSIVPLDIASGVNVFSAVVGDAANAAGTEHAFVSRSGKLTDLGAFANTGVDPSLEPSNANAINLCGLAVGDSTVPGIYQHAAAFFNGTVKDLGTLGGANSTATAVNNLSVIVGISDVSTIDLSTQHAFSYQNGKLSDLGVLVSGGSSQALGINDFGIAVGQATTKSGDVHAVEFKQGKVTDLGTLGGPNSQANAIDDFGIIVGSSDLPTGQTQHAFAYFQGRRYDLGVLSDGSSSANSVNNLGQIVGQSGSGSESGVVRAVLFAGGKVQDLNALVDPALNVTLVNAIAINDRGEIVGLATDNATGNLENFKLTPVSKKK